jgi:hypothetical protein
MVNILQEYGLEPVSRQVEALKRQFKSLLVEETQKAGNSLVLLVDESQTATKYNLELLRQLLNFETGSEKLVQIILFGQEELSRKVAARPNFLSRIVSQVRLEKLSRDDTIRLIRYRLSMAGAEYAAARRPSSQWGVRITPARMRQASASRAARRRVMVSDEFLTHVMIWCGGKSAVQAASRCVDDGSSMPMTIVKRLRSRSVQRRRL